jgi:hypothetical protein
MCGLSQTQRFILHIPDITYHFRYHYAYHHRACGPDDTFNGDDDCIYAVTLFPSLHPWASYYFTFGRRGYGVRRCVQRFCVVDDVNVHGDICAHVHAYLVALLTFTTLRCLPSTPAAPAFCRLFLRRGGCC